MKIGSELASLFAWERPAHFLFEYIYRARHTRKALSSIGDLDPCAHSLVLDTNALHLATDPIICKFSGDEDAQYQVYAPPELVHWGQEIGQALHVLEDSCVHAATFVNKSLVVLAVRADMKWQYPYSSSWRGKPGLAGVTNPHLADNAQAFIINALVHEAIHSALYCYEGNHTFVRPCGHRAISMWTGASLRLDSLVHAVFVWYGLFHLWRSPLGFRLDPHGRFLKRALTGFMKDPLRALKLHRNCLRDELLGYLELLVEQVRVDAKMLMS
jgi:hypothetical protein